ncbi:MAG: hypothetical protein M9962_06110 [Oligoflexia bacterium]|nr:hypothetical protein [Oligoflexia bacterium]
MKKNFFLCFLLLFMSLKVVFASVGSSELNSMKGLQVLSISYEGDSLPENIDTRISRTIGTSFSPFLVKNILLWHHENEGDSFLRISARKISRGVELKVFYKKKQKIEKISFMGNRDISANALETLIDFKEGFDYEPKLTEIAVQKLIAYYGKQGYFATDIKANFDERKKELLFTIFEGDPTYLDSLEISPIETIELPALKARYERDIREIFGLRVGDKIQRDKVLDGLKNIKDWLRDHDFLISKDPALEYKVDASGKVGLVIRIDYGNRIRFGFRGNNLFSYRELMNFVSELKEVTSGAEYLNSVKRRIEEEYEKIGYVNINVSTLVRDDANRGIRYVSVIIEENEKVRMKSLRIDGIYSFSKEEIEKVFNNSASRIVQRGFYQEEGVQLASELVVEYLQSKGFLSARLEFIKADFNEERTEVNVSILFNEGIQSRIKSITIDGNKNLSEQEILSFLKVKLDEPFNIFEFENGLIQIKEKYGEIGYLNAQIANEGSDSIVKYSRDNSNVDLLVEVDEGPQFYCRRNHS